MAPNIPMVVLVDHNTASSSEIVTAALQDHRRATVVGTHTFGKGVFQEEEPLSNGGALDITTLLALGGVLLTSRYLRRRVPDA